MEQGGWEWLRSQLRVCLVTLFHSVCEEMLTGTYSETPVDDHNCSNSKMAVVMSHPEELTQLSRKGDRCIYHSKLLKGILLFPVSKPRSCSTQIHTMGKTKSLFPVSKPRSCSTRTHTVGKQLLWC